MEEEAKPNLEEEEDEKRKPKRTPKGRKRKCDNATPKRNEKFEETAKQLRIPYTRKLILDCPTRWNSTYKMLEVAILYKDVFNRLRHRDTQYTCLPSNSQWQFAEDVCEQLKF
ncbi:hypothetical protein Lal_00035465 [Lupinus albus]|nr:hypothetical protein Lal_00035465 [Lupinus albus]